MEFGTSFSKLKIVRTAITYSTKKCDIVSLGTYPDNREHYTLFLGLCNLGSHSAVLCLCDFERYFGVGSLRTGCRCLHCSCTLMQTL